MSESDKNDDTMSEQTETPNAPAAPVGEERREKIIRSVCAVLFALIFLFAGILTGWFLGVGSVDERARNLAWLVERVEGNYYKEIDDETLYDALFSALELDKFCSYYNADEYDRLVGESEGNNEGFGISLLYEENGDGTESVRVYRTVFNSPAERAGLEAGMYIYRFGTSGADLQAATAENLRNPRS